jgi:hypothetical protein
MAAKDIDAPGRRLVLAVVLDFARSRGSAT